MNIGLKSSVGMVSDYRIMGLIGLVSLLGLSACQSPSGQVQAEATPAALEETTMGDGGTEVPARGEVIRFGVLAIDSAVSVHQRYGPLASYLSEALDRPVEVVALTQESQFTEVAAGTLDFITNNSLAAVQVQRLYGTQFLVTHSRPDAGPQFSALIVVQADSPIQTLDDLRGKRVACVDKETAAAGCLFQVYHVHQAGLDPDKDFSEFIENPSQDNIVLGVLNGAIDAGFIRTGQIEKMVRNGLLPHADGIRVLDPVPDGFVYRHTTALYPEWPIAALPTTDPAIATAVEAALLAIPPDHPALAAANVSGFVDAVDYQSINDLIETLQLPSWDAQPLTP